jgi:hypothetical protein
VASDPFHGDNGFDVVLPEKSGWSSMSTWELSGQKHTVWTHLALNGQDQLKLRAAWGLNQIVSVGIPDARNDYDFKETETILAFHDMLVRNALGDYRTLMREFSFSLLMARWLSFEDNRSLQYNIDHDGRENYPDENFAREIMQLFTIGLFELNDDGSVALRPGGLPKDTYTIDDIVSFSRAWTGFVRSDDRGGASSAGKGSKVGSLDPMEIDIAKRDWAPKNDLGGGFIGDKVARCVDLPTKHVLRKGATYLLLGGSGTPHLHDDDSR